MPADEVTHGTDADASRVRSGPRHAAPRKPLFNRFHMPAGKAIALAAMPTAVFMGMGLNSTFARADDHPSSKALTAEEYQKCVEAVNGSSDASSSPSPSASASASKSADTPSPSATASADKSADKTSDKTSSSDSGSGGKAAPAPSASESSAGTSGTSSGSGASTPSPSASESGKNLLETIGDAINGVLTGGSASGSGSSASASPTPSASASAPATKDTSSTVKDTTKKVTDTVKDTVKDTTDTATKAASEATKAADTVKSAAASATPSPSASSTPANCVAATDAQGGVEKTLALPDAPWHLQASSLLLKSADYQGIVKVRTANGTVKKVLKYVISGGTDIGDLHQLVDGQKGETYHVQAGKGTTSTIRDGTTVMYTESISGNLFGLIPVTFSPDNPPPLNIPLIYFTNVKVTQAGQFGGTLTVPGMHQYVTGAS
ncbi:hypothetical protein ABT186_37580 [Streptomyces sp. NPDC001634]|uniref:hypothetical protein n=1 Tax=Streptomyces sp. NPDC001634 TaxID=3154390 RepID=UPI0033235C13